MRIELRKLKSLAQLTHGHHRPRTTVRIRTAHAIHRDREIAIWPLAGQFAQYLRRARAGVALLRATGMGSRDSELRMTPSVPVNGHRRFILAVVHNDFADQNPCDALLDPRLGRI